MTALAHHQALIASTVAQYLGFDPGNMGSAAQLENNGFDVVTGPGGTQRWALTRTKKNAGKWRVQFVHVVQSNTTGTGVAFNNNVGDWGGSNANAAVLFANYGTALRLYRSGSYTTYSPAIVSGDRVDLYLDLDLGRAWWARNGAVLSGDPQAGTGAMTSWTPGADIWLIGDPTGAGARIRIRTDPAQMVGPGIPGFVDGWPP